LVLIADALSRLLIGDAFEHPMVHELGQPVTEQVSGAPESPVKIVEPAKSEERLTQHEQRPTFAHDLERALDGTVFGAVTEPGLDGVHISRIAGLTNATLSGEAGFHY
jgi:hypothetical protein